MDYFNNPYQRPYGSPYGYPQMGPQNAPGAPQAFGCQKLHGSTVRTA